MDPVGHIAPRSGTSYLSESCHLCGGGQWQLGGRRLTPVHGRLRQVLGGPVAGPAVLHHHLDLSPTPREITVRRCWGVSPKHVLIKHSRSINLMRRNWSSSTLSWRRIGGRPEFQGRRCMPSLPWCLLWSALPNCARRCGSGCTTPALARGRVDLFERR